MEQVILCDEYLTGVEIHVRAYLKDEKLNIEGQDLGLKVADTWGDSEYEYFYSLSAVNTKKLYQSLKKQSESVADLLMLVKEYFSGVNGCQRFRDFCDVHKIDYEFHSFT